MVSLYKHHAPSTTSLSDDDDNDEETNQFAFNPDHHVLPAPWAFKGQPTSTVVHRPASHSPISTIPAEIMIQIFKHLHSSKDLYTALRVSRTWCQCSVELLWHKPSFPKYNTIHKMAALLQREKQTFTYALFIRRLNFLNHGAELSDELISMFARCDRLERLTLIGCKQISSEALCSILPKFSHLVAIDLTGVTNTSSEAIIGLASVATRLQGINLSGCENVTDSGIVALAKSCPLLRRVKLSNLTKITDISVSALAENCPMLLEIDLNHCALITDVSVRLIWTHLTHMREMRLSHCILLTDAAFPAPLRPDSQGDAINPFAHSSAKTDELPPLHINRTFDNLRMLDLTACALVTDDAVEGIISHASKIRNLVLSKCVLLTDKSVETICKIGRHLHYLHLGHASKITDRAVRLLARACTRIRYIDFANCVNLTDMSVFELSLLPKLRRVGLVRVNRLTDEAIYALAERHATLERIHLSYCDQISVMAIHFLLLKLHKLTHLSLTGVPAFRQAELQRFCREAPKDFNTAQRLAFCVFSGKGVSQLRTYLTELFDRITEMNNTDDTEYEEDDIDSQEDDTPEPEIYVEARERERFPRPDIMYNDGRPSHRIRNANVEEHIARQRQNFLSNPSAVGGHHVNSSHRNGNGVPHLSTSPTTNIRGATTRLNAQIQAATPLAGPSRHQEEYSDFGALRNRTRAGNTQRVVARPNNTIAGQDGLEQRRQTEGESSRVLDTEVLSWTRTQLRPIADVLPVVESSASPSPNDLVPNDNGSGFFRTYQERPTSPTVSSRGNGALTPDLNYAEIGHGRGAHGGNVRSGLNANPDLTPMPASAPRLSETPALEPPSQFASSDSECEPTKVPEHSTPVAPPAENSWLHNASSSVNRRVPPESSALLDVATNDNNRQHTLVTDSRGRREQTGNQVQLQGGSDPRARSVKRTFRSTINAAEHYANSFFGRGDRPDAGSSGGPHP
ncbi:SCF E3 ubiquitin ligase complex F-box protein grrA [Psilocybe cubensis]|uniref:SCF E3 ubiquitin ligase complex F-box protein grrA n=2 Tax=Psilocybe cubensis TaxID=181762 RepID=A0ACB8H400_PSICU|nr:SCF E3 ubiquitin ligase complex F-box protein grrA [Psilocybe cubensis]KAH9482574.1 SCF E3 ubiquitin ligase complex F-box protein grrA [Psilocybe cubensis]